MKQFLREIQAQPHKSVQRILIVLGCIALMTCGFLSIASLVEKRAAGPILILGLFLMICSGAALLQMVHLFRNWHTSRAEIKQWAQTNPSSARILGGLVMLAGLALLAFYIMGLFFGSPMYIRGGSLVLLFAGCGAFIIMGGILIKESF